MGDSTAPVNGHTTSDEPATNGVEAVAEKEDVTMTNASPPGSPAKIEQQTSFSEVPSSLDTVTKTTTDLSIAESAAAENKMDAKFDGTSQQQNGTTESAPEVPQPQEKPQPESQPESQPEPQPESHPSVSVAEVDEKPHEADKMEVTTDTPQESGNDNNNTVTSTEVLESQKDQPLQKEHSQQPTDTTTRSDPTAPSAPSAPTAPTEKEEPASENLEDMARLRSQGPEGHSGANSTTNTPSLQPTTQPSVEKPAPADESMPDAPVSPSKPQRERDEDPSDERAAKRTKTNGDEPNASGIKSSPSLPPPATNGTPSPEKPTSITKVQHKFLVKSMQSLKRLKDARFYREPVDVVKLNIPSYFTIIKRPMDLGTIESGLKAGKYTSVQAVVDDFNTMVQNAITFNGPDHLVCQEGVKLKATFERQMTNLPAADVVEPSPADKKKKASNHVTIKNPPAKREPRQTAANARPAPAAANATSPTTFALGPEGLPLIRRDSTAADGRPKRSIHPPKNRDLPYSAKPKKKKFQWELKFCQEVLDELHKNKNYNVVAPFYYPVDPVALNIPNYHNIIKKPMDLQTVQTKLQTGQYENAKEMEADTRQIFKNCFKFNIPGDPTYTSGKKTEEIFDAKWAQKNRWVEAHEPPSGHQSVGSSDEESDENEAEESEDDQDHEKLTMLQKQIAEMSKQVEAITKKTRTPPAPAKKSNKAKSGGGGKKDNKKGGNAGSSAANKKKAGKNSKPEKQRWITYHEKQVISNGISSLPDKKMQEALKIIQSNVPSLKVGFNSILAYNAGKLTDYL